MDPTTLSATELAAAIRAGQLSAREALEAQLRQVAARNGRINAVVTLDEERARAAAARADEAQAQGRLLGPLHGVPMTVKDTFATAGLRTTVGMPNLGGNVPAEDAVLVGRLRAAGAVLFGKTNLPLASYDWQCVHPRFGRGLNPWDTGRTPGGSSGGSAAALAEGLTPLELGSDVAGSIRVPAHFCGVAGLRPTEGALDGRGHAHVPDMPDAMRSLVTCGPLARTVEDLQLALGVLWGPAPDRLPLPRAEAPAREPRGLRLAWSEAPGGVAPDRATREVLGRARQALEGAGAQVEERGPEGYAFEEAYALWGRLQGYELATGLPGPLSSRLFRLVFRLGLPALRFGRGPLSAGLGRGLSSGARGYFEALDRRLVLMGRLDAFLASVDAWVTPVALTPAFTHRRTGSTIEVDGRPLPYSVVCGWLTCPTALGGHPVVTLPAGWTPEGLPVGLQLHGRRGQDFALLAVARAVELALGFERRWPALAPSHSP